MIPGAPLLLEPGLKHQNVPQSIFRVHAAAQVVQPHRAYRARLQIAFSFEPALIEQGFRPVSQWTAQPGPHRHTESLLRPLDQLARNILEENLTEYPLAFALIDLQL